MTQGPLDWFELTTRIAGFGISAGDGMHTDIPSTQWPAVRSSVRSQRLTGLAVAGAEVGWLRLPDGAREELLADHRAAMMTVLVLERKLLALASAFEDADIEFVVLKGPAVAHAFYPNVSWRAFGDIDLLVRTRDWRAACGLLVDLGHRRQMPEPRVGFDERFGKSATHVNGDGLQVDLHRTLALGAFGLWTDPERLFERTGRFAMAGRSLQRLDDTGALLHACMHATLGSWPPRLLPVRDVAQIARSDDVDWEALRDLAGSWRLMAVMRYAFEAASTTLDVRLPVDASPFLVAEPSRSERRLLTAYTSSRRNRGGTALSTLRAIPGLRAKLAYVRALLVPDRAFLDARARQGNESTYVGRLKVPVRWLLARASRRSSKRTR